MQINCTQYSSALRTYSILCITNHQPHLNALMTPARQPIPLANMEWVGRVTGVKLYSPFIAPGISITIVGAALPSLIVVNGNNLLLKVDIDSM